MDLVTRNGTEALWLVLVMGDKAPVNVRIALDTSCTRSLMPRVTVYLFPSKRTILSFSAFLATPIYTNMNILKWDGLVCGVVSGVPT